MASDYDEIIVDVGDWRVGGGGPTNQTGSTSSVLQLDYYVRERERE